MEPLSALSSTNTRSLAGFRSVVRPKTRLQRSSPDRERVTSAEDQTYQDGADSNAWTDTADYPDCAAGGIGHRHRAAM
jgi:hypothetical protein